MTIKRYIYKVSGFILLKTRCFIITYTLRNFTLSVYFSHWVFIILYASITSSRSYEFLECRLGAIEKVKRARAEGLSLSVYIPQRESILARRLSPLRRVFIFPFFWGGLKTLYIKERRIENYHPPCGSS